MKTLVSSLLGRAGDLAQTQPLLALCLGAAMFALFLSLWLRKLVEVQPSGCPTEPPEGGTPTKPSLVWILYSQLTRFLFAATIVLLLAQTLGVLRTHLENPSRTFSRRTGASPKRITKRWKRSGAQSRRSAN